jgi:hypothetical protein
VCKVQQYKCRLLLQLTGVVVHVCCISVPKCALIQALLQDQKQYTTIKLPESFLPRLSQV